MLSTRIPPMRGGGWFYGEGDHRGRGLRRKEILEIYHVSVVTGIDTDTVTETDTDTGIQRILVR